MLLHLQFIIRKRIENESRSQIIKNGFNAHGIIGIGFHYNREGDVKEQIERIRDLLEILLQTDMQEKSFLEILQLADDSQIITLCDFTRLRLLCEISQIPFQ